MNWKDIYNEFIEEVGEHPSYFEMDQFLSWLEKNYKIPEEKI